MGPIRRPLLDKAPSSRRRRENMAPDADTRGDKAVSIIDRLVAQRIILGGKDQRRRYPVQPRALAGCGIGVEKPQALQGNGSSHPPSAGACRSCPRRGRIPSSSSGRSWRQKYLACELAGMRSRAFKASPAATFPPASSRPRTAAISRRHNACDPVQMIERLVSTVDNHRKLVAGRLL